MLTIGDNSGQSRFDDAMVPTGTGNNPKVDKERQYDHAHGRHGDPGELATIGQPVCACTSIAQAEMPSTSAVATILPISYRTPGRSER